MRIRTIRLVAAVMVLEMLAGGQLERALAQSRPTYQGRTIAEWFEVAVHDLDAAYRKSALETLLRFGPAAIPYLAEQLDKSRDPRAVTAATIALVRLGPEGRAFVARQFGEKNREKLSAVIDGVGECGDEARALVPHLQNAANYPELFLAASRILARFGVEAPEAGQPASRERTWRDAGVVLTMAPPDCLAQGQFSALRFALALESAQRVKEGRLVFRSALQDPGDKDWFFVEFAEIAGQPVGSARAYEAKLPKPHLVATAIHYFVEIETDLGILKTDETVATVKRSTDDCTVIGALPAASLGQKGSTRVYKYKTKKPVG